jgi:ribosomal protein S18 acetylase RimI-like enzyme
MFLGLRSGSAVLQCLFPMHIKQIKVYLSRGHRVDPVHDSAVCSLVKGRASRMQSSITFRLISPADEDFLRAVYASTRMDELVPLGWDEEQKHAFLSMQFAAQHTYYQKQFPHAAFQLILLDHRPIGRLYVDRRGNEIRLLDITLVPEHRNAGIGTTLLKDLLAEAARLGKPVRLHVKPSNPARRLYQRLGFHLREDQGVYLLMEWSPHVS